MAILLFLDTLTKMRGWRFGMEVRKNNNCLGLPEFYYWLTTQNPALLEMVICVGCIYRTNKKIQNIRGIFHDPEDFQPNERKE
jgi:hypothetical protein